MSSLKLARKKTVDLFKYQEKGPFRAIEVEGNKFILFPTAERQQREVSGQVSPQGAGASYRDEKTIPKYDGIVILSGSNQPLPMEKWREQAIHALKTVSGGKALPDQLGKLSFSVPIVPNAPLWSQAVRPPSEYIKSRIRKSYQLFSKGGNVTNELEIGLVAALANSSSEADADYQPAYHPIPGNDIISELQSMERHGEVRVEGIKVRFLK